MEILLAFVPVFVAVDPIGILPLFVSLSHQLNKKEKQRVIFQSLITALCLSIGFIFLGKLIFKMLGITIADFMVAGGAVLFSIALNDLLSSGKARQIPASEMGAVPIGTPLIVGPAVLTTSLIIIEEYGLPATVIAILANILLVGLIFLFSDVLIKILGQAGARAMSKVMALLLAAIAVMMIRKGIFQMFGLAF